MGECQMHFIKEARPKSYRIYDPICMAVFVTCTTKNFTSMLGETQYLICLLALYGGKMEQLLAKLLKFLEKSSRDMRVYSNLLGD